MEIEFKVMADWAIIDLPLPMRRFGLYRWRTARRRRTKWHLIDTERGYSAQQAKAKDGRTVAVTVHPARPVGAEPGLPSLHPSIPMLCGVSSRGPVETLIRTWDELCTVMGDEPKDAARDGVCAACLIQVALAMTNEFS